MAVNDKLSSRSGVSGRTPDLETGYSHPRRDTCNVENDYSVERRVHVQRHPV